MTKLLDILEAQLNKKDERIDQLLIYAQQLIKKNEEITALKERVRVLEEKEEDSRRSGRIATYKVVPND